MKCNKIKIIFILALVFLGIHSAASPDEEKQGASDAAGEFFGVPVSKDNYYFVGRAVSMFNTPWGGIPRTEEQYEERIWNDLLMSYEAYRRGIEVSQEELDAEIAETLRPFKLHFDWKKDKKQYRKWLLKNFKEKAVLFENQMRHLVQLKKLRQQVLDSIEPVVTEDDAYQEFLNEHNTLSVELAQFDEQKDAEDFYVEVKKNPKLWDEKKDSAPDKFKHPGFVSLEFLMYMWELPKSAVYDMIEMEIDSFYKPAPVYEGYAVFKVLQIRKANPADYEGRQESYLKQVRENKKYNGYEDWLEKLKKDADIKKLIKVPVMENKEGGQEG